MEVKLRAVRDGIGPGADGAIRRRVADLESAAGNGRAAGLVGCPGEDPGARAPIWIWGRGCVAIPGVNGCGRDRRKQRSDTGGKDGDLLAMAGRRRHLKWLYFSGWFLLFWICFR